MNGNCLIRHVRGHVLAEDIAKVVSTDGIPISSRGKGRVALKAALPLPASGDVCIELPRFSQKWGVAGLAIMTIVANRKCSKTRVVYDVSGKHQALDPWDLALRWLVEFCEDLSARLWDWRPIASPWEIDAIEKAQTRLSQAMDRWADKSPALYRLANQIISENNYNNLYGLCKASAISELSSDLSPEEEIAQSRICELGLAVCPQSALSFRKLDVNIIKSNSVSASIDELLQVPHDDIKSAAVAAQELLMRINECR